MKKGENVVVIVCTVFLASMWLYTWSHGCQQTLPVAPPPVAESAAVVPVAESKAVVPVAASRSGN